MQDIILAQSKELTMSSREIAELTGKNHSHVFRDIKSMLDRLGEEYQEYIKVWTHPQNKQSYEEFVLCDNETGFLTVLLSGYKRFDILKQLTDGVSLKCIVPHKVRSEISFGEKLVSNLFSEYEVIPQFKVLGGKYFIDWYVPELNIAIEYDELHHKFKTTKDRTRQAEIEKALKCKFIRYTEGK